MVSEFQMSVLHEPSHTDMFPQNGTVNRYKLNDQFISRLVIQNISPRPDILWTMDGEAIDGLTVTETNVQQNYRDMQVNQTIKFIGQENFSGKYLEFEILLEVVDEFDNKNEDQNFSQKGNIKLFCSNCQPSTSTSFFSLWCSLHPIHRFLYTV